MGSGEDPKERGERARKLILSRRAKFVAAALASVAAAGSAEACGGATEPVPGTSSSSGHPNPCLSVERTDDDDDNEPQPCLGIAYPRDAGPAPTDASPQPCLDVAYDASPQPKDSGTPQPCLSPQPSPQPPEDQ